MLSGGPPLRLSGRLTNPSEEIASDQIGNIPFFSLPSFNTEEGGGVFMPNGNGGLGSGGCSYVPVVEEYDDEEECAGLEPFFFDEAEAVADHERRMRREQEAARGAARFGDESYK